MARQPTTRPADFTGRQAEILAEQAKGVLKEREGEISLFNANREEEFKNEVSYAGADTLQYDENDPDAEPIVVKVKNTKIRVNSEIEQMTFGHGNYYDFEPGRTYIVPYDVAEHLERLGYVYH